MTPEEHDYVTELREEVRRLQGHIRYLTRLVTEQSEARIAAEARISQLLGPDGLEQFLEDLA